MLPKKLYDLTSAFIETDDREEAVKIKQRMGSLYSVAKRTNNEPDARAYRKALNRLRYGRF